MMYVRPKLLFWLVPIFIGLFIAGMIMGTIGNRNGAEGATVMEAGDQSSAGEVTMNNLLEQLTSEQEHSFVVYMQNNALNGTYDRDHFSLSGDISGHKLEISRNEQQALTVLIDGQPQNQSSLPYALYTPNEHAALIKGVLQSVTPAPIQDPSGQGWRGYRLSIPAQEVTSMLEMWLGPSFPTKEITPELAKRIQVQYQLWYDSGSGQIRQMEMELQMKTAAGEKRDQIRFRL